MNRTDLMAKARAAAEHLLRKKGYLSVVGQTCGFAGFGHAPPSLHFGAAAWRIERMMARIPERRDEALTV